MLQADGGDLEVVGITGSDVKLRLKGACGGCPHATMTIKQGLERILREQVDPSITIERVA
jgi:Fe-S cluster biogenesis protein NfuA